MGAEELSVIDDFRQALIDYLDGKIYTEALEKVNFLPLFIRKTYIEITKDGFIIRHWEYKEGKVYFKDQEIDPEDFLHWFKKFGESITRYSPDELKKYEEYGYEYYGIKEHMSNTYFMLKNGHSIVDEDAPIEREWLIELIENHVDDKMTYEIYGDSVYVEKRFGEYSVIIAGQVYNKNRVQPIEIMLKHNEDVTTFIAGERLHHSFEVLVSALSTSTSISKFLAIYSML